MRPWDEAYDVEVLRRGGRVPSDEEWGHLYRLYENVRGHNLALNTFALPEDLFPTMLEFPSWELLLLRLRPECGGVDGGRPQGFIASYVGPGHYSPIVAGMDYRYIHSHALYRQLLSHVVDRAEILGADRVLLGMGAELEKQRFGADRRKRSTFVQSNDSYHYDVLSLISSISRFEKGSGE